MTNDSFISLSFSEIEKTAIRFYGHPGIKANVKAICQVENGPVYELYMHGQASYMAYRLNTHELDFGDIHFDKISTRTLTLTNVGSVPLDFHFLNLRNLNSNPDYSQIEVEPESGICAPHTSTVITVKYLPNIPEKFQKNIFLQIAHFQPDEVHLIGTGMFCRLEVDLPRFVPENSPEQQILQQIEGKTEEKPLQQQQLDTFVVQNHVHKSNEINSSQLIESFDQIPHAPMRLSNESLTTSSSSLSKRSVSSKSIPTLPDYVVDFNYIILGTVRQHAIHIRNPTNTNLTFHIDRLAYRNTGFSFDCDRVKNLPPGENMIITVTFDPRGANLELGPVECRIPVEVRRQGSRSFESFFCFRSLPVQRFIYV